MSTEEIQVLEDTITTTSCTVRVGDKYLTFGKTSKGFECTARGHYVNGGSVYIQNDADFFEAHRQAKCAVQSKLNETKRFPFREEDFVPNEYAVTTAQEWARRIYPDVDRWLDDVITAWLVETGRWTTENEREMRSIARERANKKAIKTREKKKYALKVEAEKARQYDLF